MLDSKADSPTYFQEQDCIWNAALPIILKTDTRKCVLNSELRP